MYEITNRLSVPYASICYIECEWSNGTATRASGVVVGINDVLTALHVVYQTALGGWATKVTVIPAADTRPFSAPYGEFSDVGSIVGLAPNWDLNGDGLLTQAEAQGDMALLGMKSRIGDVTGWLPVAQASNDFYGVMVGYPARGSGMMAEAVYADASSSYSVYSVQSGLGAGASGGPLLQTVNGVQSVTGVLSSGSADNSTSTYAGLFSAATWQWLQTSMAANNDLVAATPVVTPTGMVYTGGSSADVLTGGAGRDSFTGNGGNDTLDGGANIDTAIYNGARAGYTVTVSASSITIADSVAARDGTDMLRNIERVKFSDISLAFDVAGNAGQAYRLYQTAFNRPAEAAGLGFQMKALDDGLSLVQVAGNFIASPEFVRSYGALDDSQFVTQLYANVLHRAPDAGGLAFHTGNLANGSNSRADVVVGFSESPENQAAVIGSIQNGMQYTV